jgi:hypothetical protein
MTDRRSADQRRAKVSGLNRLDVWYGAPVGDWKVAMGGFYRYDDGIRDPGFHGDDGGQFRVSLARDFEGGKVSFDLKRLDDKVYLDLGIPMRTYPDGKIRAVPGFDGNYGTIAGPETESARMPTASGTDFLFDNTLGTQIQRTQATLNFEFELADQLCRGRVAGFFPLLLNRIARRAG